MKGLDGKNNQVGLSSQAWQRFVDIVRTLRGPSGCPWDKEQTYQTLVPFVIEEAYEVAQAAVENDVDKLKEELGDLMLEIGLYATIGEEQGDFAFDDVLNGISDKLIRRHPHVFGEADAQSPEDVERLWSDIKRNEPGRYEDGHSLMDEVGTGLPALMRAQKQQRLAATVGFDWPDSAGVIEKIEEELEEVKEACTKGDSKEVHNEVGDLLFACVNLARHLDVHAESALMDAIEKFGRRFRQVESYLRDENMPIEDAGLDYLDELWERAKMSQEENS